MIWLALEAVLVCLECPDWVVLSGLVGCPSLGHFSCPLAVRLGGEV